MCVRPCKRETEADRTCDRYRCIRCSGKVNNRYSERGGEISGDTTGRASLKLGLGALRVS